MNKTIALDIDDTLGNLAALMNIHLNKLTGKNIHWKSWNEYDTAKKYGITTKEFLQCIIDNDLLIQMKPFPKTIPVLTNLKKKNYNLVAVTARSYHPNALQITKDWFNKYNIPIDAIHVSEHGISKVEYVRQYENIVAAVDDKFENCEDFENSGIVNNTLIYNMPWNIERTSTMKRIDCLSELERYT